MAAFPEALFQQMERQYAQYGRDYVAPVTTPRGLQLRVAYLERATRQTNERVAERHAAAAAGVSVETWRRWKRGTQRPGKANTQRLQDVVSSLRRLGAGRRAQADLANVHPVVRGRISWNGYYNRQAERTVHYDFAFDLRGLVVPWLQQDMAGLVQAWNDAHDNALQATGQSVVPVRYEGDNVSVTW